MFSISHLIKTKSYVWLCVCFVCALMWLNVCVCELWMPELGWHNVCAVLGHSFKRPNNENDNFSRANCLIPNWMLYVYFVCERTNERARVCINVNMPQAKKRQEKESRMSKFIALVLLLLSSSSSFFSQILLYCEFFVVFVVGVFFSGFVFQFSVFERRISFFSFLSFNSTHCDINSQISHQNMNSEHTHQI